MRAAARRLFSELRPADLERRPTSDYVIGRLLEEGDRDDLRWLTGEVGEERLERWLADRGARQLSRRSRAFWTVVLAAAPPPAETESPLWPL